MVKKTETDSVEIPVSEPPYPILLFVAKHDQLLSGIAGLLGLMATAIAVVQGCGWVWIVIGILASGILYFIARCFGELIRLIANTLIPQ